jgi:hypothetical protein
MMPETGSAAARLRALPAPSASGPGRREQDLPFRIWDADDEGDRRAWIEYWTGWPAREVFAHPDYLLLYAGHGARPLCAAYSTGGSHVLYPFLLRRLGDEPYCDPALREGADITSPYGYGGRFAWGRPWDAEATAVFQRRFDEWAAASRLVSEVARLSLFPETLLPCPGSTRPVLDNVVRTLTLTPAELWKDFEYKVRKNIQRAQASGVTILIDEDGARLDDFLAIYAGTMIRRKASAAYAFPRDYFERICHRLPGQFVFFHALAASTVIATELVLVSAQRIYSFLGGTNAAYFPLRPNDLLKFEIMNWAREQGKQAFVLGGGYIPGDGIYRYKLSFAPQGRVPFCIGSRILDADAYTRLLRSRAAFAQAQGGRWDPQPGFFPAYRG